MNAGILFSGIHVPLGGAELAGAEPAPIGGKNPNPWLGPSVASRRRLLLVTQNHLL